MGLLGDSWDDPRTMASLQLAAGLLSGGNFGQAAGRGLSGYQATMAAAAEQKQQAERLAMAKQLQAAQIQEYQAQAQQREAQAQEMRRKAAEQERIQGALQAAVAPVRPVEANAASGITGPRPEALASVGQRKPIDYQGLLAAGVPPELVKSIAESANYGRSEVARTLETQEDGRPVTRQFDKYGQPVGSSLPKWVEPKTADLGGKVVGYDPVTGKAVYSFGKTMTPGETASNSLGWANYGLSRQRLAQEASAGQLVETDGGYVRVGKDNTSRPITGPDGKPLMGKGGVGTEDERKAAGWVAQAENAWQNMRKAGFDKDGKLKSEATPGLYEAWTPEVVANAIRSSGRQQFVQAGSSLSEALLRAATGAGVNKDEAAQKVRELTPQPFDSAEVIAQKMNSIPVYLEALRTRSGKALPKNLAPVAPSPLGTSSGPRFLGFE